MGQSLSYYGEHQNQSARGKSSHSSRRKEMQNMVKVFDISNSASNNNCATFLAFCADSFEKVPQIK
jgi:hypothetical protein